ncbi:MAG TPA: GNAT family N-acetyltransferase [Candidatus Dormibacteraeota bacterium]|nr:GNAT family N-acetyltransferase [Candidatus Dormibacteraeota bacterium]
MVLSGPPVGPDAIGEPSQFLAVASGRVIGYAGVDEGQDAEVCGMVHPDHRRRGVGAALLDAALQAAAAIGRKTVLVICEDVAPVAIDWMRRRGAEVDMSELRMVLRMEPGGALPAYATGTRVVLRKSTAADRSALRHLLSEGFPELEDGVLEVLLGRHDDVQEESMIVWDRDRAVGTLRVIDTPERSMVYGLVIDSALRGKGYGGAAMRAALDLLRERGVTEVSLEVLPDNEPAVRLYTRLGFKRVTTYRYLRVSTQQPPA